jgi:HEAT repeat protein
LGKIKEQPQSVPVRIAALKDLDVNIRRAAAAALGQIGEREKTVPALKAALNDSEVLLREAAKRALTKLDGKCPRILLRR